jgi:AmpD protein
MPSDQRFATDGLAWTLGWYAGARHCASPNFGARPAGAVLDLVLLHSISLPPGVYTGDAVERLFTNTLDWDAHPYFQTLRGLEVSAHFLIRRDGALWQFVSCEDRAWHAGASSFQRRDNCNDFSIGVELEGLEGDTFEPAQYAGLRTLLRALSEQYPLRHLAGHSDVAPGRKIDPGPGFEWHRLSDVASQLNLELPAG